MSCVHRAWLPGLCGWPLGSGPGQGHRACSPWCRLLRACHHPVPPFGRVSRLQAEDKLAFCFPWVYFNCIAATPDNGHILSPGNCPPPTGSCVLEKQDHHFQTCFSSSPLFKSNLSFNETPLHLLSPWAKGAVMPSVGFWFRVVHAVQWGGAWS